MKRTLLLTLAFPALLSAAAGDDLGLLPEPKRVVRTAAVGFRPTTATPLVLQLPDDVAAAVRPAARALGFSVSGTDAAAGGAVTLRPSAPADSLRPHGYRLRLDAEGAVIAASDAEGFRYGLATLRQLMDSDSLPALDIHDYPGLEWRGVMLDVSRHFSSVDFVRRQVDLLARYKINRLHLHLTDGAGWRMEVKRYPRLTQFAAWRPQAKWKDWWNADRHYAEHDAPGAYGGYYTQDELRDLVAYAAERGVTVVPEIEMPGHSEEVLAAYPELSCTHEPYKQADFCPGNEETFRFLENVLTEVMDVFPSPYIHIGGDEAAKASWPACPLCQQRMKEEGLADVEQLQGYFVRRIGRFLESHGRHLIGWDEILSDSLPRQAAVMVWRDTAYVKRALAQGKRMVLAPAAYFYLDYYQDAPHTQPEAIGGYVPLEKVYSFDAEPMFADCPDKLMGIQGNLWREYIPTDADVERMLYPRVLAVAEQGWTTEPARYRQRTAPRKDYAAFRRRALRHVEALRAEGVQAFDLGRETGRRPESQTPVDHMGVGCAVTYNAPFSPYYPAAGAATLTDGRRGDWTYGDGAWQGFISRQRLDVTVDLGRVRTVKEVSADFFNAPGAEVLFPVGMEVELSVDGREFTAVGRDDAPADAPATQPVCTLAWRGEGRARYVRVKAPAGPSGGWVFTDEVVIR